MTTSDEMGNFCHDHIQHPLMWCDEKKRLIERKNAEESLRMWRRRKAEEIARKEKDKQEYYDMFLKHCPWGRPGGGAPNVDVRRKDITAVGLHSTPSINTIHRLNSLQTSCRYADYFSQRKKCHDPLAAYHSHLHHHHHHMAGPRMHHHLGNSVTVGEGKSGERLEISLKDQPSMSFRNKGQVDIEVRYKPMLPTKGKPMLEKIVVTESDKCPMVQGIQAHTTAKSSPLKNACFAAKMEKPPSKDPWGKAGPGGKPWRSPKEVGSSFMKSLGWTNKEMLKDLDQDNPATPAEKPTFRKVKTNKKPPARCCDVCTCTCQAPSAGPATGPHHGSCSPLKSLPKKPMPCSPTKAATKTTKFESIKQKICPRFARRCPAETNTTDTSAMPAGGGVELVPLLARRRANARPISLSSTDVTKRTVSNERLSTAVDPRYLHDLNTQISQKRRSISVAEQIEKDLCNRHFQTFDTFWGRPGHGAPGEVKTKLKLDNLLYGLEGYSE